MRETNGVEHGNIGNSISESMRIREVYAFVGREFLHESGFFKFADGRAGQVSCKASV